MEYVHFIETVHESEIICAIMLCIISIGVVILMGNIIENIADAKEDIIIRIAGGFLVFILLFMGVISSVTASYFIKGFDYDKVELDKNISYSQYLDFEEEYSIYKKIDDYTFLINKQD